MSLECKNADTVVAVEEANHILNRYKYIHSQKQDLYEKAVKDFEFCRTRGAEQYREAW